MESGTFDFTCGQYIFRYSIENNTVKILSVPGIATGNNLEEYIVALRTFQKFVNMLHKSIEEEARRIPIDKVSESISSVINRPLTRDEVWKINHILTRPS